MPPTLLRSLPPQATTSPGRTAAGWAAAGLAALVGAAAAGEVLHPPSTVDLVVLNQSAHPVTVVVSSGDGGGFPVATLDPGEERPVVGVLDRGDWVVTYQVAGEKVATQEMAGSALEEAGYRLTVPADVDAGADERDEGTEG